MKSDIKNRDDIIKLVDSFYNKIKTDKKIGYFFNEVAHVNWEMHLPTMYDFWENILFSTGNFSGNPMEKHKQLHQKSPMTQSHFSHWIKVFHETVDDLFQGAKAEEIKLRAVNIATAMMHKTLA